MVFNQDHLRCSLKSYLEYHPGSRTHLDLDKDPNGRPVEPLEPGPVKGRPMVG
ncbi:MAG: hypothetical protein ABIK96_13350 [bacterium]